MVSDDDHEEAGPAGDAAEAVSNDNNDENQEEASASGSNPESQDDNEDEDENEDDADEDGDEEEDGDDEDGEEEEDGGDEEEEESEDGEEDAENEGDEEAAELSPAAAAAAEVAAAADAAEVAAAADAAEVAAAAEVGESADGNRGGKGGAKGGGKGGAKGAARGGGKGSGKNGERARVVPGRPGEGILPGAANRPRGSNNSARPAPKQAAVTPLRNQAEPERKPVEPIKFMRSLADAWVAGRTQRTTNGEPTNLYTDFAVDIPNRNNKSIIAVSEPSASAVCDTSTCAGDLGRSFTSDASFASPTASGATTICGSTLMLGAAGLVAGEELKSVLRNHSPVIVHLLFQLIHEFQIELGMRNYGFLLELTTILRGNQAQQQVPKSVNVSAFGELSTAILEACSTFVAVTASSDIGNTNTSAAPPKIKIALTDQHLKQLYGGVQQQYRALYPRGKRVKSRPAVSASSSATCYGFAQYGAVQILPTGTGDRFLGGVGFGTSGFASGKLCDCVLRAGVESIGQPNEESPLPQGSVDGNSSDKPKSRGMDDTPSARSVLSAFSMESDDSWLPQTPASGQQDGGFPAKNVDFPCHRLVLAASCTFFVGLWRHHSSFNPVSRAGPPGGAANIDSDGSNGASSSTGPAADPSEGSLGGGSSNTIVASMDHSPAVVRHLLHVCYTGELSARLSEKVGTNGETNSHSSSSQQRVGSENDSTDSDVENVTGADFVPLNGTGSRTGTRTATDSAPPSAASASTGAKQQTQPALPPLTSSDICQLCRCLDQYGYVQEDFAAFLLYAAASKAGASQDMCAIYDCVFPRQIQRHVREAFYLRLAHAEGPALASMYSMLRQDDWRVARMLLQQLPERLEKKNLWVGQKKLLDFIASDSLAFLVSTVNNDANENSTALDMQGPAFFVHDVMRAAYKSLCGLQNIQNAQSPQADRHHAGGVAASFPLHSAFCIAFTVDASHPLLAELLAFYAWEVFSPLLPWKQASGASYRQNGADLEEAIQMTKRERTTAIATRTPSPAEYRMLSCVRMSRSLVVTVLTHVIEQPTSHCSKTALGFLAVLEQNAVWDASACKYAPGSDCIGLSAESEGREHRLAFVVRSPTYSPQFGVGLFVARMRLCLDFLEDPRVWIPLTAKHIGGILRLHEVAAGEGLCSRTGARAQSGFGSWGYRIAGGEAGKHGLQHAYCKVSEDRWIERARAHAKAAIRDLAIGYFQQRDPWACAGKPRSGKSGATSQTSLTRGNSSETNLDPGHASIISSGTFSHFFGDAKIGKRLVDAGLGSVLRDCYADMGDAILLRGNHCAISNVLRTLDATAFAAAISFREEAGRRSNEYYEERVEFQVGASTWSEVARCKTGVSSSRTAEECKRSVSLRVNDALYEFDISLVFPKNDSSDFFTGGGTNSHSEPILVIRQRPTCDPLPGCPDLDNQFVFFHISIKLDNLGLDAFGIWSRIHKVCLLPFKNGGREVKLESPLVGSPSVGVWKASNVQLKIRVERLLSPALLSEWAGDHYPFNVCSLLSLYDLLEVWRLNVKPPDRWPFPHLDSHFGISFMVAMRTLLKQKIDGSIPVVASKNSSKSSNTSNFDASPSGNASTALPGFALSNDGPRSEMLDKSPAAKRRKVDEVDGGSSSPMDVDAVSGAVDSSVADGVATGGKPAEVAFLWDASQSFDFDKMWRIVQKRIESKLAKINLANTCAAAHSNLNRSSDSSGSHDLSTDRRLEESLITRLFSDGVLLRYIGTIWRPATADSLLRVLKVVKGQFDICDNITRILKHNTDVRDEICLTKTSAKDYMQQVVRGFLNSPAAKEESVPDSLNLSSSRNPPGESIFDALSAPLHPLRKPADVAINSKDTVNSDSPVTAGVSSDELCSTVDTLASGSEGVLTGTRECEGSDVIETEKTDSLANATGTAKAPKADSNSNTTSHLLEFSVASTASEVLEMPIETFLSRAHPVFAFLRSTGGSQNWCKFVGEGGTMSG